MSNLSQQIKIVCLHNEIHELDDIINQLNIKDSELASRLVIDEENPDYIIATDKTFLMYKACNKLRDYFLHNKESIFIFFTGECLDADLNLFDYAFTLNSELKCGDRIVYYIGYINDIGDNTFTREEARKILENAPKFCNFIYSHEQEPRDSFFHMLSRYKRVDSLGKNLNNTDIHSEIFVKNWYQDSINLKTGYKFSLAIENAAYKGYTTEKIISSLQAHNVPIYWGDPAVTELINPKAFINCADYDSFNEVIERVKEIDNDDEKWLDMVTQPWQTEEQKARTFQLINEYDKFIHNIFSQDINKAHRKPEGIWGEWCQKNFTGVVGIIPPLHMRIYWRICRELKNLLGKFIKI